LDNIGEDGYQETEKVIPDLLKERIESLRVNVASTNNYVQANEFEHS